jgi:hypothetical protein
MVQVVHGFECTDTKVFKPEVLFFEAEIFLYPPPHKIHPHNPKRISLAVYRTIGQ